MVRLPLTAALLLALSTPALAGVTADQLWQAMRDAAAAGQGTLTAREQRSGSQLVLTGLAWQPDLSQSGVLRIDRMVLAEQPDGSVSVILPPEFPLTILPDPAAQSTPVVFNVAAPDLAVTIRGLGNTADVAATASSISATLDEDSLRRPEVEGTATAALAAADLALHYRQDLSSPAASVDGAVSLGALHAELRIDTPQNGKGTLNLDLAALAGHLRAHRPASAAPTHSPDTPPDLPAMIAAFADGMFLDAGLTHGAVALLLDVVNPQDGPVYLDLAAESGRNLARVDSTAAAFDTTLGSTRLEMRVNDPTAPIQELDLSLGEYSTAASLGLGDLVTPQPWSASHRILDLALSESFWSLADPDAALPHDPLTLSIGLSGLWALDPAALKPGWVAPSPDAPPPLTTLTMALDDLLVQAVGARLTGKGGLSFDMADTTTFDGAPLPTGRIDLAATGINTLIDRLVTMGLVSPDDLTGLRFGLMAIARAGAEPDSLTTALEFRDKGFWLNGVKIR